YEVQSVGCFQRQMGQVDLGVGDMAKIFYHGICNFISRLRYISRFIICRVTRFGFLKKRTLQRGEMCPQTFIYLPLRTLRCRNNTASIGYWPKQWWPVSIESLNSKIKAKCMEKKKNTKQKCV